MGRPLTAIAGGQRWGFGDDGFVEHQQDRAAALGRPGFQAPFACRQVAGRLASTYRGRFQR
jgi:hypothetical protein